MKMYAPANSGGTPSVRGFPLPIADDGSVEVMPDVAQELRSFGFTETPPPSAPTKKQASAQEKAKADAKKAYDEATDWVAFTQQELMKTEGRGDADATAKAEAVFNDAVAKQAEAAALAGSLGVVL